MTEIDDIMISGEFAAFREAYAPTVQPAGTAAVRETVRRRRRRTAVATAAAVVLAVAIPVAANAALDGRSGPAPVPAESADPTPSVTTPSPTSPSPTPSATPSTASPTPGAPDGRISRAQLLAARVDLPNWPSYVEKTCTTAQVRLVPGPVTSGKAVPALLGEPGYGDLDGDGAAETVALLGCRIGEAQAKQLVAFDRDATGRITTMGQVVGTFDELPDITGFSVQADGKIRARVGSIQPCCDTPQWWAQQQWRTYAWTGDRFDQSAGPTKFGTDPRLTDLTLVAGDLVLNPPDADGKQAASLTVTVTNKGPVDVAHVGFDYLTTVGELAGGDLSRCRMVTTSGTDTCLLGSLRSGAQRTYTFRFLIDPALAADPPTVTVVHYDAQDRNWPDLRPEDNHVTPRKPG
ncbi:hypothetical protein [Micromonospora narathiwatensis]|uniref:Uncharacterized protein n=1 Tax=Micromonospora narathiwatensis TaxID=299146 RepID=A0A1A9A6J1_9ACTN|nr:hypothetical protein [Micromonospora narathiwatensis]SBT51733.1 hypothetical protein GA0070621_4169 [Micromonospora narathiwatensis]